MDSSRVLEPGNRVRLLSGEYEGFEAEVTGVQDCRESVQAIVNVFGHEIVVQVRSRDVMRESGPV